jgi:hypothetical protein
MASYKSIIEHALGMSKRNLLAESLIYPDNFKERMHPNLEEDLLNNKTSLGESPCFPISDERNFATKIVGERFKDVVNEVKKAFNIDEIDNINLMKEMMPLVMSTMELESDNKKELVELAIKMVREEFDIPDDVIIEAELTKDIDSNGTSLKPKSDIVTEFDDHDEMEFANDSVYKRRFVNAMNQGAAKKVNHMYHLADKELTDINPKLINNYKKMMSSADYMYYLAPELESTQNAGKCDVDFGSKENDKPTTLTAKAMVFPVLLHELVKGCMEILSAHGLPTKKNIAEYVINKSDFVKAEPWDMRIGPALWTRFCMCVPAEDFNLKHHVYADICILEPKEFSKVMREVMAGTNKGKKIISEMIEEIKNELKEDEYNQKMNEDDGLFEIDDLF